MGPGMFDDLYLVLGCFGIFMVGVGMAVGALLMKCCS